MQSCRIDVERVFLPIGTSNVLVFNNVALESFEPKHNTITRAYNIIHIKLFNNIIRFVVLNNNNRYSYKVPDSK